LGTPRAVSISLGREADHSLPSCAEVKEWVELYLQDTFMALCSVKESTGTTLLLPLPPTAVVNLTL